MDKLSRNEKILVGSLLVLLLLFVYCRYILFPVLNSIEDRKASVNSYMAIEKDAETKKKINVKQEEQISQLKVQYETALKSLPKSHKNPEITYELKKLAGSNNVTFLGVTFSDGAKNTTNTFMYIPAAIKVSGSYKDVMNFVSNIEKGTRIAELSQINLTKAEGGSVSAAINVNYIYEEGKKEIETYDFNKNSYGKDNMFQ